MKQLQVGDRVKSVDGGKDDEGTVHASTSVVILVVGRFTATICGRSGRTDEGPRSVHKRRPTAVCSPMPCKMGLEGIVSKRLGSRYRSGRSPDWLKMKNPNAPAVKREAEEDWSRER